MEKSIHKQSNCQTTCIPCYTHIKHTKMQVKMSPSLMSLLYYTETKRSHLDETDGGGNKNSSKSNDTEMQRLNEEGTKGETVRDCSLLLPSPEQQIFLLEPP